jgi:hypothetical protein
MAQPSAATDVTQQDVPGPALLSRVVVGVVKTWEGQMNCLLLNFGDAAEIDEEFVYRTAVKRR